MNYELLDDPSPFLTLLPSDWRDPLEHWMKEYPGEPKFTVLRIDGEIVAGGALFRTMPPGLSAFEREASEWLARGYGYLGFIWVVPERRGEGLGRRWLNDMLQSGQCSAYWLTVEEESLIPFYERCGFKNQGAIPGEFGPEWLFVWPG